MWLKEIMMSFYCMVISKWQSSKVIHSTLTFSFPETLSSVVIFTFKTFQKLYKDTNRLLQGGFLKS